MAFYLQLPRDLQWYIGSWADVRTMQALACTCRVWAEKLSTIDFWRQRLQREFSERGQDVFCSLNKGFSFIDSYLHTRIYFDLEPPHSETLEIAWNLRHQQKISRKYLNDHQKYAAIELRHPQAREIAKHGHDDNLKYFYNQQIEEIFQVEEDQNFQAFLRSESAVLPINENERIIVGVILALRGQVLDLLSFGSYQIACALPYLTPGNFQQLLGLLDTSRVPKILKHPLPYYQVCGLAMLTNVGSFYQKLSHPIQLLLADKIFLKHDTDNSSSSTFTSISSSRDTTESSPQDTESERIEIRYKWRERKQSGCLIS